MKHIFIFTIILATLLVACGSGNNYGINLELVEPIDQTNDPFATIKTINFTVINAANMEETKKFIFESTTGFSDFAANLNDLEYWPEVIIRAEGFDPEEKLVAMGQTTHLSTQSYASTTVAIYFAPVLSISIPPQSVQMRHKRAGLKMVVPSSTNLLVVGGIAMNKDGSLDNTVSEVGLFLPQSYYLDILQNGENNYNSGNGLGITAHSLTPLSSGSILVAGGYSKLAEQISYIEKPVILSALTTSIETELIQKDIFTPRINHQASINYTEEYALVCGGRDQSGITLNDCFKVTEDDFSMEKLFEMQQARSNFTQTNAVDEESSEVKGVLFYGGNSDENKVAEWQTAYSNESILLGNAIQETRTSHASASLSKGRIIISGGLVSGTASDSVVLFDSNCMDLETCQAFSLHQGLLKTARYGHSLTAISANEVLACGGYDKDGLSIGDCELIKTDDENSVTQKATIAMNYKRAEHDAVYLPDGTVMIAGGYNEESGALDSVEIFMPETF